MCYDVYLQRLKKKSRSVSRPRTRVLLVGPFEDQGGPFREGRYCLCLWSCLCLWRRVMQCRMSVDDVFLRCVHERYDAVCHVCSTRKTPLAATQDIACGPKPCPFSRTSNDCLSTSYSAATALSFSQALQPSRHALGCHLLDGEKFLCKADHLTRKMLVNTWCLRQNVWCIY